MRGILQRLDPLRRDRALDAPGVMARLRSQVLDIARASGATNIADALWNAAIDPTVSLSYRGL